MSRSILLFLLASATAQDTDTTLGPDPTFGIDDEETEPQYYAPTDAPTTPPAASTAAISAQCQRDRFCVTENAPNFFSENDDYVILAEGNGDCDNCKTLCAATSGCTGYQCGDDYCQGWLNDNCAKTEFYEPDSTTTCRMVGNEEIDTSLCPMYVDPSKCFGVDVSTCNWAGCTDSAISIDMSYQSLKGSLSTFTSLKNLKYLDAEGNDLTGEASGLKVLSGLVEINLGSNKITGSVTDLAALTTVENLNMEDNKLTGSVAALTALTNIKTLDLSGNQLTGAIPKFLCDGHIQCDLSGNYGDFLSGKIGVCVPDDCGSGTVCNVDTSCSATVVVTDE